MSNQKPKAKKPDISSDDDVEIGGDVADSFIIHGDGNVINVSVPNASSDDSRKKPRYKKTKKINAVWIAVGVIVLVVFIAMLGKRILAIPDSSSLTGAASFPTETVTSTPSPAPTDTATLLPPTLTLIPATDTPTTVPTPTLIPPVALGEDWIAGCISTLWRAYPSSVVPNEKGNGCWKEPVHVFSAENGDLDFLFERGNGAAEVYGLFAPLPESGTVTFNVRLKDLDNVDLWMGIFPEPDVTSQGLLMTILNGDVSRRSFVQKNPITYETIQGTVALNQGNGYSISFTFTTLSARSRVNPNVFMTNQVSMPLVQKWLFLGYKGLRGAYRIEGTFLNFELKQ